MRCAVTVKRAVKGTSRNGNLCPNSLSQLYRVVRVLPGLLLHIRRAMEFFIDYRSLVLGPSNRVFTSKQGAEDGQTEPIEQQSKNGPECRFTAGT